MYNNDIIENTIKATKAFGVKAIALILSALGIADMWMAVFADTGVTILAVLNSFRALKIENN